MTRLILERLQHTQRGVFSNDSEDQAAQSQFYQAAQRQFYIDLIGNELIREVKVRYGLLAYPDDIVVRTVDISTPEDRARDQVSLEFRGLWQPNPERGVVIHFGRNHWPIVYYGIQREWKSGVAPQHFTLFDRDERPVLVETSSLTLPAPETDVYNTYLAGIDADLGILVYSDRLPTNGVL